MAATSTPGWESFVQDVQKDINLDDYYNPYPMQRNFHESTAKHPLLGGAAGPGKTLALLVEHLVTCNEFSDPKDAVQVHTLLCRRTYPQLKDSVIQRFREKIPKELYRNFHEQNKTVTWLNGATTTYGAMQHENDYLNYQGSQWLRIDFDELTQFTFKQFNGIAPWNRCPVSPHARRGGATNPIGIGAGFVKALWVDGKPCPEMDGNQRAQYRRGDYAYFPSTYLDNPVYANDQAFIAGLMALPAGERDALMYGKWGAFGTYFDIYDPAIHVYAADEVKIEPWWPKWVSGDWGFEHWAAIYWHTLSPLGIVYTYREMVTRKQAPKMLAESIVSNCLGADGVVEKYEPWFYFSHDAFAQRTDAHTIAAQMAPALKEVGLTPINAGTDKVGGEQLMYQMLQSQVKIGEVWDEANQCTVEILVPSWQITDAPNCGDQHAPQLRDVIARAPRDEKKPEQIAKFEGDDPIDGARHGIYGKFGGRFKRPLEARIAEKVTASDPTVRALQARKAAVEFAKEGKVPVVRPGRWRPRRG